MIKSLTKYRLWSSKSIMSLFKNLWMRWCYIHSFHKLNFEQRFGLAKIANNKIHAETTNDGAKELLLEILQDMLNSANSDTVGHWWWVLNLRIWLRNQDSVIALEAFTIPEAKKKHSNWLRMSMWFLTIFCIP